jgi:hypothetical protein
MKTLWSENQENPSDRISHAWAPLKVRKNMGLALKGKLTRKFLRVILGRLFHVALYYR